MDYYGQSEEHRPLFWFNGKPLYATHVIVIVYVVSMIATVIVRETPASPWLNALVFSSDRVLAGEVWRLLTFGLVNLPSLGFALDMLMLFWFGREVERYFGRRIFFALFATLYLLPVLFLTLVGLRWPTLFAGETGSFALFIAFATLYPDTLLLFNVPAKWAAIILVGLSALIDVSNHDFVGLTSLLLTSAVAYGFVRFQRGQWQLPALSRPRPRERAPRPRESRPPVADSMAEVDALLDKIAQSGIHSLTPVERAKLDAARDDLRKRNS